LFKRIIKSNEDKWLIFLIVLSLAVRVYLFLDLGAILGADVGRMAIISHTWFLKGEITPDLRPYDMANGFFYFPGVFLLPLMFEYLGVDSITTVTFFSFLFSFLGILVFYKIARIFLNEKQSIGATFFYSFVFDIILIFNLFGVFPYGFASFFFLLTVWFISKFYFSEINKKDYPILFLGIFGVFSFHWYLFIPSALFIFSCFMYDFVQFNRIKNSLKLISIIIAFLFLVVLTYYPYLSKFWKFKDIPSKPVNTVDLLTFQATRLKYTWFEKFQAVFFMSYMGALYSSILIVSFLFFLFFSKEFKGKKVVWLFFFIFVSIHSLTIFYELNLMRVTTFLWLPYSLVLGQKINKFYYFLILIPMFFFIQSPSIFYLIYSLKFKPELYTPLVNFHKFNRAMNFIREEIPENATFLIDGGGSGCTGTSASYGERIFPLTSRKIFYFTDYCWANYNRTEFEKRVDLYRRVSINSSCCMDELKDYNITHVFIGERWIALNPRHFENNINYELVYDENGNKIFKIK